MTFSNLSMFLLGVALGLLVLASWLIREVVKIS